MYLRAGDAPQVHTRPHAGCSTGRVWVHTPVVRRVATSSPADLVKWEDMDKEKAAKVVKTWSFSKARQIVSTKLRLDMFPLKLPDKLEFYSGGVALA